MFATTTRRSLRALAFAPALLIAAACSDDPTGVTDPAEDVEAVSLTVTRPNGSSTTYSLAPNDNSILVLGTGANTITASFVDGEGSVVPLPSSEFRLEFEGLTNGVTFTRSATNGFAGTLAVPAGVTAASGAALLWHIPSQHEDFEVPILIQVQ